MTPGGLLMRYRRTHLEALQLVLDKADAIDGRFGSIFGRSWGGLVEEYRCRDADHVLLTIGSMTGTARVAVDLARERGLSVGLLKVRYMRPFPAKAIAQVLAGRRAWASVDRSVCFGWNCGPLYAEVLAAERGRIPGFSIIGGLGGADISLGELSESISKLCSGRFEDGETHWLDKTI
jgi:pyruvate ferredoxin oxidoreductase alpha subunit/phenylglyoxylate dehydrogenase alpha subunit